MGFVTRRGFLLSAAAGAARAAGEGKGTVYPTEWRRYADPTTEFEVFRLTAPAHSSTLPPYYSQPVARRGNFLLFCSDRTGTPQAFRMDLATGECRQLTGAGALDGGTLALLPDARGFCFFDGAVLRYTRLPSLAERAVYTVERGWERCRGLSVTGDGLYALFGERRADVSRLRLVNLARGTARTVTQAPFVLADPIARPRRAQVLFRDGERALWLVNTDGRQGRPLKLAAGRVGPANWAPSGRTVLYLNIPDDARQLSAIREYTPDANTDQLVAKTSQFAHFGFNGDSSVFIGASRNKAAPTILILLRVTRREMTLCEHRAADPATVAPFFAPGSQRIFFQSDQHGKPAIYMMRVERLVEKIDES